mgnify:CR=1 FL=1
MTHNVTIPPVLHNAAAIFHARIAEDLFEKGWSVQPDYLGIGLAAALKTRMAELEEAEALTPAGIGRIKTALRKISAVTAHSGWTPHIARIGNIRV